MKLLMLHQNSQLESLLNTGPYSGIHEKMIKSQLTEFVLSLINENTKKR